jgi:putative polyhydroxyalkanoate system protein
VERGGGARLSLTLKTWCFPVVGCVGYRGYYDRAEADALAGELRAQGWEVRSTACRPIRRWAGLELAGRRPAAVHLHRLARGRTGAADLPRTGAPGGLCVGDTEFNESYATAVERLGGRAGWTSTPAPRRAPSTRLRRPPRDFKALTLRVRRDLAAIYADPRATPRPSVPPRPSAWRAAAEYAALKAGPWAGFAGYDGWFARANNAASASRPPTTAWCRPSSVCSSARAATFARFYAAVRAWPTCRATSAPPHWRRFNPRADRCPTSASTANTSWAWPRRARSPGNGPSRSKKFDMECTVIEGETSDTVEFTRSGCNGRLIVAADHFDLDAKLGFLLGAFSKTIEGEIEKNLDSLLAASEKKPAAKAGAARPAAKKTAPKKK